MVYNDLFLSYYTGWLLLLFFFFERQFMYDTLLHINALILTHTV